MTCNRVGSVVLRGIEESGGRVISIKTFQRIYVQTELNVYGLMERTNSTVQKASMYMLNRMVRIMPIVADDERVGTEAGAFTFVLVVDPGRIFKMGFFGNPMFDAAERLFPVFPRSANSSLHRANQAGH
jgi:hypothetical protein